MTSSGETTQIPSPRSPVVDMFARWREAEKAHSRSLPYAQFQAQAQREEDRLDYQIMARLRRRRETLPFDRTLDFRANSENNVRERWVEQGIWKSEWGSAWPKGTQASEWWSRRPGGPYPRGRWGHEKQPAPEPQPQPPRSPRGTSLMDAPKKEQRNAVTEEPSAAPRRDITKEPTATSEGDTSASRPYYQFLYQISKECEWITDEHQSRPSTGYVVDIENEAFESVKKMWIEDGIWNFNWDDMPGMTWNHEDPDEEYDRIREQARILYPDWFYPVKSSGSDHDSTDKNKSPSLSRAVEATSGKTARPTGKGKRTKPSSHLPTSMKSTQTPEKPAARLLRTVRSSKVKKPSKAKPRATKARLRNQNDRSVEATEACEPTGQDDTLLGSGNGGPEPSAVHQHTPAQRPIRRGRRLPLGPVESSRVSKVKNKAKYRRGNDASLELTACHVPLAQGGSKLGQPDPSPIEAQKPSAPRRSARIAALEKSKKAKAVIEQTFKVEIKETAKGGSKSNLRNASIAGGTHRMQRRPRGVNGRTKVGGR